MTEIYNLAIPAVHDYQIRYLRDIKLNRKPTQVGNQCLIGPRFTVQKF